MSGAPWLRVVASRGQPQRRPKWKEFCWYCGVKMTKASQVAPNFATSDHVQPVSRGGGNYRNRVPCCRKCNRRKDDLTLAEYREALGGGLFWGELHAPHEIEWTEHRPDDKRAFRRWYDTQRTVGTDDWMEIATAAKKSRHMGIGHRQRQEAKTLPPIVYFPACRCWWCRLITWVRAIPGYLLRRIIEAMPGGET